MKRWVTTRTALGLALAAAACAAVAPRAVPPAAPAAGEAHAPLAAGVVADVSANWAGYVATGPGSTETTASSAMTYTDVTGRWRQPKVTCTPGVVTSTALWVGLGGYSESSRALEQAGTSADCDAKGRATYYAWYELVPADSVTVKIRISPGDIVTSSVVADGSDILVQVKNRTRRTSFTKHLTMASPDLTSAEWIVEAPAQCASRGYCRQMALSRFDSVDFTRTFAIGNSTPGTITNESWLSTPIRLVPRAHRFFGANDRSSARGAGAAPSDLLPDGTGFTVIWRANAATGS